MIIGKDDKRSENIKKEILSVLGRHPEGLTIKQLSDMTNLHRQTVTKYIFELKGAGLIFRRPVGSATLHYLTDSKRASQYR